MSARHPLALTRAEYEAQYSQLHPPQVQSAHEVAVPLQTEETRPNTPRLPSLDASCASAAAPSSSTTVSAAHSNSKLHKTRSRKRRAEIADPSAEFAKQATSGPVLSYPATHVSAKSAAAAVVAAPSDVLKTSSSSTHANLKQFALTPSRDSSESLHRPLQIVEPTSSSEPPAAVQPSRASTPSVEPFAPPAATSSTNPLIVLDDDTPPAQPLLTEEDD